MTRNCNWYEENQTMFFREYLGNPDEEYPALPAVLATAMRKSGEQ